jgi:hypothetical protein
MFISDLIQGASRIKIAVIFNKESLQVIQFRSAGVL